MQYYPISGDGTWYREVHVEYYNIDPKDTITIKCTLDQIYNPTGATFNNRDVPDKYYRQIEWTEVSYPKIPVITQIIDNINLQYNWGGAEFMGFGIIGVMGILSAMAGFQRFHLPSAIVIFLGVTFAMAYFKLLTIPETVIQAVLVMAILTIFQRGHK